MQKKRVFHQTALGNTLGHKIYIPGLIKNRLEFHYGGGVHGGAIWLPDYIVLREKDFRYAQEDILKLLDKLIDRKSW